MKVLPNSSPKVALVLTPAWSTQHLPLGLATVSSLLRRCGCQVKVFDLNIACWHRMQARYGDAWRPGHPLYWGEQSTSPFWRDWTGDTPLPPELEQCFSEACGPILDGQYDILAFSLFATNLRLSLQLAARQRSRCPNSRVVIGGPAVSRLVSLEDGEHRLDHSVGQQLGALDAAVVGEAEGAVEDLLAWWGSGSVTPPPEGVAARLGGRWVRGAPRSSCDFTSPPSLDYDDFDPGLYAAFTIPMEVSRGCVGRCAFCTERDLHQGYRMRSVASLLDAFHRCIHRGYRSLSLGGSTINGHHEAFTELLYRIVMARMKIYWGGSIRLNPRMGQGYPRLMALAGCCYVNFGLESASPNVMRKMNKFVDPAFAAQFIREAAAAEIKVSTNIITGFPGETEGDHRKTLEFVRENAKYLYRVHVSPCQIFVGSQIHSRPEHYDINDSSSVDKWIGSSSTNTPDLRRRRAAEVIDVLEEARTPWIAPFGCRTNERVLRSSDLPAFRPPA